MNRYIQRLWPSSSSGKAVDPHSFIAYPDPAVLLNADPYSALKFVKNYLMKRFFID